MNVREAVKIFNANCMDKDRIHPVSLIMREWANKKKRHLAFCLYYGEILKVFNIARQMSIKLDDTFRIKNKLKQLWTSM